MDYGVIRISAGLIALESGESPVMLQGMDALVQAVVIELCSKPLPPHGGSGFASGLLETPLGSSDAGFIVGARLRNARQNILSAQRDQDLPPEERLADLTLLALRPNYGANSWEADIRLLNSAGQETVRTFG